MYCLKQEEQFPSAISEESQTSTQQQLCNTGIFLSTGPKESRPYLLFVSIKGARPQENISDTQHFPFGDSMEDINYTFCP